MVWDSPSGVAALPWALPINLEAFLVSLVLTTVFVANWSERFKSLIADTFFCATPIYFCILRWNRRTLLTPGTALVHTQQLFDLSFVEGFSTDFIACCVSCKAYWFNDQPQLAGKAKESDFFWSEDDCYFKSRSADGPVQGNNISFGCFERLKNFWVIATTFVGSGMLHKTHWTDWTPRKVQENILFCQMYFTSPAEINTGACAGTKLGQCYIEGRVPQPLTGTGGSNLHQPFPLISCIFWQWRSIGSKKWLPSSPIFLL